MEGDMQSSYGYSAGNAANNNNDTNAYSQQRASNVSALPPATNYHHHPNMMQHAQPVQQVPLPMPPTLYHPPATSQLTGANDTRNDILLSLLQQQTQHASMLQALLPSMTAPPPTVALVQPQAAGTAVSQSAAMSALPPAPMAFAAYPAASHTTALYAPPGSISAQFSAGSATSALPASLVAASALPSTILPSAALPSSVLPSLAIHPAAGSAPFSDSLMAPPPAASMANRLPDRKRMAQPFQSVAKKQRSLQAQPLKTPGPSNTSVPVVTAGPASDVGGRPVLQDMSINVPVQQQQQQPSRRNAGGTGNRAYQLPVLKLPPPPPQQQQQPQKQQDEDVDSSDDERSLEYKGPTDNDDVDFGDDDNNADRYTCDAGTVLQYLHISRRSLSEACHPTGAGLVVTRRLESALGKDNRCVEVNDVIAAVDDADVLDTTTLEVLVEDSRVLKMIRDVEGATVGLDVLRLRSNQAGDDYSSPLRRRLIRFDAPTVPKASTVARGGGGAAAAVTLPLDTGNDGNIESPRAMSADEPAVQYQNLSNSHGVSFFRGLTKSATTAMESHMSTSRGMLVDLDATATRLGSVVGAKSHTALLGRLKAEIIRKAGYEMIDGLSDLCNEGGRASSSIFDLFAIFEEHWGPDPRQYPSLAKDFAAFYLLSILNDARSLSDLVSSKMDQMLAALDVLVGKILQKKADGITLRKSFANGTGTNGYRTLSPDYRSASSKIMQEALTLWFGEAVGAVLFRLLQYSRATVVAVPIMMVDESSCVVNACVTSHVDPAKQKAEILRTFPPRPKGSLYHNILRCNVENAHLACVFEKTFQEVIISLGVTKYDKHARQVTIAQEADEDVVEIPLSQNLTQQMPPSCTRHQAQEHEVMEVADEPAPSALRLSMAQNESALSDLQTSYDSRIASSSAQHGAIKLELVQCDLFIPYIMTQLAVYDPDSPITFHDVLVAGSELFLILKPSFEVSELAKGAVLADASNTANDEHPSVKPGAPACEVMANLTSSNDDTKNPLFEHTLATAARDATNEFFGKGGERNKAWMTVSKLKGPCKTQMALVAFSMVQVKTFMLISVDDWRAKFPGRADFFKGLKALCSITTNKPFLPLRISELIKEVLVKGTAMELSSEHERVRVEAWNNIAEDFTGRTWLPQIAIAEAGPLELESFDTPWTPPAPVAVAQPVFRPFLSKDNHSMNVIRRAAVRSVVFTQESWRVANVLVESGYPEDRLLHLPLSVLCLATSDLGNTQAYNFLMDDDAAIRAKAAEYLRLPNSGDRSDKGGAIIKMLTTLDAKLEKFRGHHVFVNLSDDVRNGTTATLDRLASYFERLAELAAPEEEVEDDESIGGEE